MKICIGGDLCPTEKNQLLFYFGNSKTLLTNIYERWNQADIRIFNLETPITTNTLPLLKNGPNLRANPDVIKGIKDFKPSLICLANNHIMDYGLKGLEDTLNTLNMNNIQYIGAGENLYAAKNSSIMVLGKYLLGVYNCAENEFGIAEDNVGGANPFDPLTSLDDISTLRKKTDYVIVIFHAGKEHYRYPSPNLQKICRRMVDKGADFVVTQHSHCIGCMEVYNGKNILYGQGNFIFNHPGKEKDEFWDNSLLVEIDLDTNNVEYIPFKTTDSGVRLCDIYESKVILDGFNERSRMITQPGVVQDQYSEKAKSNLLSYLESISGQGKVMRKLNRLLFKGFFTRKHFNKQKLLKILNLIECEAHRELVLTAIRDAIHDRK